MMIENPLLSLILLLLQLYSYVLIAMIVMSWLVAFGIINRSNPYVRQIGYALERLTEPVLRPIRRFLPDLGGLDISPIFVFIGLWFLGKVVIWLFVTLGWA